MALQLAIVSVTTADLGVAYFLLFQFSMRSILQLWLWITFYFWGAVCWANKRAVNSVRHSEHVSRGEKQCITINSPYWAFHCPPDLERLCLVALFSLKKELVVYITSTESTFWHILCGYVSNRKCWKIA